LQAQNGFIADFTAAQPGSGFCFPLFASDYFLQPLLVKITANLHSHNAFVASFRENQMSLALATEEKHIAR
jgi:hypothetical protein